MANWCSTTFRFRGKKNELETLYDKIKEWTSSSAMKTDFGDNWLGNIVIRAGHAERIDNKDASKNIDCRGSMTGIGDMVHDNTGYYFDLWTNTAWVPMGKMWELVISSLDLKTIGFTFEAEECGCELYWRYDPNNYDDFTDEIYIDAHGDKQTEGITGYYTKRDSIDILNEFFGTSLNNISDFHDLCREYENSHDGTCITIHEFEMQTELEY